MKCFQNTAKLLRDLQEPMKRKPIFVTKNKPTFRGVDFRLRLRPYSKILNDLIFDIGNRSV